MRPAEPAEPVSLPAGSLMIVAGSTSIPPTDRVVPILTKPRALVIERPPAPTVAALAATRPDDPGTALDDPGTAPTPHDPQPLPTPGPPQPPPQPHGGLFTGLLDREPPGAAKVPRLLRERAAEERARRKGLPPKPAGSLAKDFWREVFADDAMTLDDLLPWRVRVAWRWTREVTRICGVVKSDEYLSEALVPFETAAGETVDPWTTPLARLMGDPSAAGRLPGNKVALPKDSLTIAPPPLPAEWADPARSQWYVAANENHDPVLAEWMSVFEQVVELLGIGYGSELEPKAGRYGLTGMREHAWVRLVFPSPLEILAYEEILVGEAVRLLVRYGTRGMIRHLQAKYGLTFREAESLGVLGRREAKRLASADVNEDRALMVLRLEDFISRARKVHGGSMGASREEIAALKQLAIVQGLSKAEAHDEMKEILGAIRDVARMDTTPEAKALPAPAEVLDIR